MTIQEVETAICGISQNWLFRDSDVLASELAERKRAAIVANDEVLAKNMWCLANALEAQRLFISGFAHCKLGEFYSGWCALERADVTLGHLKKHFLPSWQRLQLAFVERKVEDFQGLFPYKLFMSVGMLVKQRTCSTCDAKCLLRRTCGHVKGEIYRGEMCCDIISEGQLLEVSLVEDPVDRCCVPFTGGGDETVIDNYDYSAVAFVVDRLASPFHDWKRTETFRMERFEEHPAERNDKCPCGSGRKFKSCCMREKGIRFPHQDIEFEVTPPSSLPSIILPGLQSKVRASSTRRSGGGALWAKLARDSTNYPTKIQ
jgi:hypothetical protein